MSRTVHNAARGAMLPVLACLTSACLLCSGQGPVAGGWGSETTNGAIAGLARSGAGNPVYQAAVRVRPRSYIPLDSVEQTRLFDILTRQDGSFFVARVPPGAYVVEIADGESTAVLFTCTVDSADTTNAGIQSLGRLCTMSGTIRRNDDESVDTVFVAVEGLERLVPLDGGESTYVMDDLPSGEYSVVIIPPDSRHDRRTVKTGPIAPDTPVTLPPLVIAVTPMGNISFGLDDMIADGITGKVGLNCNHIRDKNESGLIDALTENGITGLRYPGTFPGNYLFDSTTPDAPYVIPRDTQFLAYRSFATSADKWYLNMGADSYGRLLQSCSGTGTITLALSPIMYDGTQDTLFAGMSRQERINWLADRHRSFVRFISEKGYPVARWEIGHNSESAMSASEYAEAGGEIAHAIKTAFPDACLGINGGRGDTAQTDAWFAEILPRLRDDIDFVATSQYPGHGTVESYESWRQTSNPFYDGNVRAVIQSIQAHAPGLGVEVAEFSGFAGTADGNEHWHGLLTLNTLGDLLSHNEVEMVHYWISQWLSGNSANPRYHFFTDPVGDDYSLTPPGQGIRFFTRFAGPVFAARGITGGIIWYATRDSAGREASIFLINRDRVPRTMELTVTGEDVPAGSACWHLVSDDNDPHAPASAVHARDSMAVTRADTTARGRLRIEPVSATVVHLR